MDEETGAILRVHQSLNLDYMPLGIVSPSGLIDDVSMVRLNDWWRTRAIPATRDGITDSLNAMGLSSSSALLNKAFGMSLTDQYWFCPLGSDVEWKDVSFFRNDFSEDVGDILFSRGTSPKKEIDLHSPDNTSDGWLRKRWKIMDGKRVLLKGGSDPFQQEPFNEVIASKMLKSFSTPHVDYFLVNTEDGFVSVCENFISEDEEFISAYSLYKAIPESRKEDKLTHFKRCFDHFEIPNTDKYLNDMIILDYLIMNTDRHEGNFGFIRDVNTLKFKGPAPIFDNGTSLWHNQLRILPGFDRCQPFRTTHSKQIKLVSDFSNIDWQGVDAAIEKIPDVFKDSPNVSESRASAICSMVKSRFNRLMEKYIFYC